MDVLGQFRMFWDNFKQFGMLKGVFGRFGTIGDNIYGCLGQFGTSGENLGHFGLFCFELLSFCTFVLLTFVLCTFVLCTFLTFVLLYLCNV